MWLVILGIFVLLIAVAIWAFTGTIPETMRFTGVVFSETSHAEMVYSFIPISESKRLGKGMKAQVFPNSVPREDYGYILGIVESIGDKPVTEDEIFEISGNAHYAEELITQGNIAVVAVRLEEEAGRPKWSTKKGGDFLITNGTNCDLYIVIKERKPYELILNNISG